MSVSNSSHHIVILAGEASGDSLAADLVSTLLLLNPTLTFSGMGGPLMKLAGVNVFIDSTELAVVGIWEVVTHLQQLRKIRSKINQHLKDKAPDAIILVDYPGFNLRIAKLATQLHIPVIYYVSPQIWAWHYRRIHYIKKYVNHMLVLFSFEKPIYEREQIPVTWVGHPAVDRVNQRQDIKKHHWKISKNSQEISGFTVALLPGSRQHEIERLLPEMIFASQLLRQKFPHLNFVLPLANSVDENFIKSLCPTDITLLKIPSIEVLPSCDAAMVTSGTATLEVALCQTPMVIVYKTNWLTYWLAKKLIKLDKIGLCNIIAGKIISKELIQKEANANAMSSEITRLLTDQIYRQNMIENFITMKKALGQPGASARAAQAVLNILRSFS